MKNLWAPWRMAYIEKPRTAGEEACIFCRFPKETDDRDNLVLARMDRCFVVMNRFPYSNGHVMVVPYAHEAVLDRLDPDAHDELFRTVRGTARAIREALDAEGMNVGMNLGRCAGAGIADHLHVHIVPRWSGDTNFMPVIGETKVISEHILATYDKLKDRIAAGG